MWRFQPLNMDIRPHSPLACLYLIVPPIFSTSLLSFFFWCSLFLSFQISSKFSWLWPHSSLSSSHRLPFFFSFSFYSPLLVTALADIRINSLDFSAHSLTVNRKWLIWISILLWAESLSCFLLYNYTVESLHGDKLLKEQRGKEGNPIKWDVREGEEKVQRRHMFVKTSKCFI